ncbi:MULTISPECIES: glycoside hydrolase family 3 protein [Romboutsia]|uniref:beta-N-acetylhexosaminidase n=1 Tax=Romboutsia hominis TaxID=1507512 RepID=A0A2P2BVU5_9FIRM|nr:MULTISPECIES: glycoside hydrolase family 3 N-terminal domain-containing protein [Romboutsia]MCH1960583.1 glycosyl hydrolase family 3 [Romboutsia hominis]MCH1968985.1 glycosyl hydrolase family 3 [Romboutsia hominis]MDB8790276.1 glycoside hydrolase family 3 N-terminal domain-containing protein [Romboutsia sp. 1001216sp1]MDB8802597.1 glycoside hydrolase family 3 N-terminal domain-containing protein [Romboutsia sp. 1001216sp1]MDB8805603.1 glycoside hydrolase family 3 N-terminal domain-containin
MKIDLKAKPFYLEDEDIKWVEDTLAGLSLDEKIGQVFVDMLWNNNEEEIKERINKYGMGGFRYSNMSADKLYEQNMTIQNTSKIPALIAANIEAGGDGGIGGGTHIGYHVTIGATQDKENAYKLGYYGCKEAAAIGCNWTYAPIVDINKNWRNCVVSSRCFSSDADVVLEMSKEYLRGANDAGLACCMKHFPGDGLDERDQHIVTTNNMMSCEEWDNEFGKVYKGMIDAGVESVMIGHIRLPEYSRKLKPGIKDNEIMPATIAPELLQGLLREQLGFNGLILTDATHMVGLTSMIRREDMIPTTIASGCDMILYYRDKDEDVEAMKKGLENGILTHERLDEAVTRVLAFKAMLKLHKKKESNTLMPPKENLSVIGCEKHLEVAKDVADKAITLVKNTKNQLPITPETHKRIMLYTVDSTGFASKVSMAGTGSLQDKVKNELEAQGFEVEVFDPNTSLNGKQLLAMTPIKDFVDKFDAVMLFVNVQGFSQSNVRRITWAMPMGPDIPWYVTELPTVCVSVNNPFHLIDVPMVPTYINAYTDNENTIHQVIQKIMGKSEFKGVSSVDAFCDSWDTRL